MVALAARFVRMGKDWRDRVFSRPTAPLGTPWLSMARKLIGISTSSGRSETTLPTQHRK